jgi:hypothetical protein
MDTKHQNISNKQFLLIILAAILVQLGLMVCFEIFNASNPINIALTENKVAEVDKKVDDIEKQLNENQLTEKKIDSEIYIYHYENTIKLNKVISNQEK